jgi:type I restriction enzyme, S subunit
MSGNIASLVSENLDVWTAASERGTSGPGRSRIRASVYGVGRLRALILHLAVRGLLVPNNPADAPAGSLLAQIRREREVQTSAHGTGTSSLPETVDREPFRLPPNWVWLPLGQTGNIFSGTSINATTRSRLASNPDGVPFVATKDVGYGLDPITYDTGLLVPRTDRHFKFARPHSVFICAEGGSAGKKIAISDREIAFGNKLLANETWSVINPKFVLYVYMSSYFLQCFMTQMTGIIGGISLSKFLALPFPLPPLDEQRRIVDKLDELMALCNILEQETASAAAAHQLLVETLLATLIERSGSPLLAKKWSLIEDQFGQLFTTELSLEALKQSVVDLAVSGKLVPQDPEDEHAEILIERIRSKRVQIGKRPASKMQRSNRIERSSAEGVALPPGWCWAPLAQLGETVTGGTPKSSEPANFGGPIPFIGPGQITQAGKIIVTERSISERGLQQSSEARPGDVLMVCIGGSIGKSAIVQSRIAFNQQINALRPILVDSRYAALALRSSRFRQCVLGRAGGSATPIINRSKWESIPVAVPPLAEQKRIVAKVNELISLCDPLQSGLAAAAAIQRDLADAFVETADI